MENEIQEITKKNSNTPKVSSESLRRLSEPGEIKSPEELYDELIALIRKSRPDDDISIVERAYAVACKAHADQKRKSGEPYIIHPLEVAKILVDLGMDLESVAAGIMHDVVEDTDTTLDDIREQFGDGVAELVDGVTKLTKIKYTTDKIEIQAENLRKMLLAMSKDIRVVIIKLADRLHNMRTLQYMSRAKQIEKAKETMEIYAPIAGRLGISKVKTQLDDLAFKYSNPDTYFSLIEGLEARKATTDDFIKEMLGLVKKHMADENIKCDVEGRVKHTFSIYKKMVNQNKTLDQIYDIFAVRIIVDSVKDCYAALGILHEIYKPVPGRFKDYIAMPKANMYQSLHTTLISHTGQPFEVQIRTHEMHLTAEYGIAAHWKYKEGKGVDDKTLKPNEEEKLSWLKQILDWQQEMSDNHEFMTSLKSDLDLFTDDVFCFTPQGDVKTLPAGSTPIDFAYSIHSAVGNKMVGARVNEKIVNIDYKLQSGDRVEIITSQNSKGPSMDWLNIVKSSQARSKINQWFRTANKDDNIARGKLLVEKYVKAKGINEPGIFAPEYIQSVLSKYSCKDWESVLAAIGHGGLKEGQVINRLYEEYRKKNRTTEITDHDVLKMAEDAQTKQTSKDSNGIVVKGIHDVAVRFSKCCNPVPGDDIVGFITRGRGVTIHRTDCDNIIHLSSVDRARLIEAQWDKPQELFKNEKYAVEICVYATNRVGMIVDISRVMSELDLNVTNMNARLNKKQEATISIGFDISSKDELEKIIDKIRLINGVIDVTRTRG